MKEEKQQITEGSVKEHCPFCFRGRKASYKVIRHPETEVVGATLDSARLLIEYKSKQPQ